jgi:predicted Zn-dependent protease
MKLTAKPNRHKRNLALIGASSFLAAAIMTPHAALAEERYEYSMNGKPVSQEAYDSFNKGRQLLRVNNNSDAATLLKRAAELMPDNADVHHTYAVALAKAGQSSAAIQELQTALSLNSNAAATWMTLGGLYQSTGQLDKAIESYKGFLSRFPTDKDAKKISGLVSGLEAERARQQAIFAQTGVNPNDDRDYFVEVTRDGVIRWSAQQMPLRVFITNGDATPGYRPQFADLLKQSFASWSQASSGLVSFSLVDNIEQAQIVCLWSNDPAKFKNIAEAGHAVLDTTRNGLVKGTITLLTVPLVEQLPLTDNRMRRGCLHEIGHVLGLAGHTSNPDDAMFYSMSVDDKWKDLNVRDANTIVRLYSKPPATSSLR